MPIFIRQLIEPDKPFLLPNPLNKEVNDHVKFGLILMGLLVVTIGLFAAFSFRLTQRLGMSFFGMYLLFITYALVQELYCNKNGISC